MPGLRKRKSALMPVLILSAVFTTLGSAADGFCDSSPAAAVALARFAFNQQQDGRWPLETIDIEASLPKLNKNGRLRATRQLFAGRPRYRVVEITGDPTIKRQVLARYLSADVQIAKFPAGSTAMTPANYQFQYVGSFRLGQHVAYAFRLWPRKKRQSLINGVLWLDGETSIAVRRSGYLVRSPSVFVKRVDVTTENSLRDGKIEARVTHLSIHTRLVGRAQLLIVERPLVGEPKRDVADLRATAR